MSTPKELRSQAKKMREVARKIELLHLAQHDPERLMKKLVGEQRSRVKRKLNYQISKALRQAK